MKLYEINREIEDLFESSVDKETGEISSDASAKLDELIKDKNQKILNTAKFIKNRTAFVEAMRAEMKALQARVRSEEVRMEWLENYAKTYMAHGEKYEDAQCAVSLRKSSRVDVKDINLIPADYKKEKIEITADKKAIGDAIKSGKIVDGAVVVDTYSMQIK